MINLSERETIDKVKSKQSILTKIQDIILFGKGTREDLKEFDMRLREDYNKEISSLRQRWQELYLEVLESNQPSLNRKFKNVTQAIDIIKEQVNRGTYGYAPLFNRSGHIRETELARVFNFDKEFAEYLDRIGESEDNVAKSLNSKDWKAVSDSVDNVKTAVDGAEKRWKEREKYFRSKEI
ncbi:MAG: hypothetical protein QG670_1372 [Thermoproteota archaeon]|nr:hypothetical protein [Thermoproteota archaeon]